MAEVGLAAFSSIVAEGAKSLFKPIVRQISYVFKYQSYIDGLKDQVKQLGYRRETVQQPVNHARLQGDEIYEGVTDWLNQVDEFSEGVAKSISDDEDRAKKSCFKGLCPNLISRYKLSKQAAKAAEAAASLLGKGNFSNVSYRPAPKRAEHMQVKDYEAFDSRMKVFQDVVEALKDDKLNIIGVYGMGGVGKTTLVKQVAKQVMEDKLFDKVVMAEVTQTPDHQEIQKKLAFDLGMKFGSDENKFERADRLRERLKKEKRVLIILDNIWTELELDVVGIPSGDVAEKDRKDDQRRCTIILTSRKQDLLRIDMSCQKNFPIDALPRKEALQLFEKRMFNIPNVADLEKKMEETIRKDPIAISLTYGGIQVLPERLQCPCLELLHTEGDGSMQVSDHFFKGTEGLKVLNFTRIHFSSLPSSLGCLINLQTLCLDYCRLKDIAIVGQLKKLEILILARSTIKQLPLEIGQLTRLQLLDLSNCWLLEVIAPNVISKLSQLEELYMGNSFSGWEKVEGGSNASLVELERLTKLATLEIEVADAEILPPNFVSVELQRYRIRIGDESEDEFDPLLVKSEAPRLMMLKGLEKVSILQENDGTKMLLQRTEGLWLETLEGVQSVVHELDDGEGFPRLKHLHVKSCSEILHIVGSVRRVRCKVFPLLESLSLMFLTNLETICYSQLREDQSFSNLRIINVDCCPKLKYLFSFSMAKNLLRLQKVEVENCDDLKMIIGPDMEKPTTTQGFTEINAEDDPVQQVRLPSLEVGIPNSLVNLNVSLCEKIEEIIGHVGEEAKENRIAFSELKLLELDYLPRLTSFCSENYTLEFPSLEQVSMTHCLNMKTFSQGILSTPKLCKVQEEGELRRWEGNLNSTIQKCYEEMIGFRDIIHLQLSHFPRLKEIWHGQALPVSFFNNLFDLVVDDCTNMSSAIPANLLRCLNNLVYLEVRNCDSLEEVLHLEELINADKEHIGPLFPKLFKLGLTDLPKLKRFFNFTRNIIELPKLRYLTIENCPDMETFISNSTSVLHMTADNKEAQKLKSEKNLLVADQIQHLFNEKHLWKENDESSKAFANLGSLEISECSKLQKLVPPSWHLENLWELEVSKCHGLINVLTLSTSKTLVNLERMKIADCKMIEEIIQSQVGEEAEDCIVFRKLEYLGLDCLPSLTSFCLGNYALEFPSLEHVVVRQCPTMKIFSQGVVDAPKLNKVKPTEEEDGDDEGCWEGNLNDTIKKLFNEMVSINEVLHYLANYFYSY
ncbi:hypothetical protein KPL71_014925 [Citrus sinensis]|uniref:Uncharacterized protein n=1 Tax=Citrus sinensis TaxID=2711 RepID=A0ACB8KF28_CITSI|nr:hypothetical protein KPL71_014925 [Citrus sinensis]